SKSGAITLRLHSGAGTGTQRTTAAGFDFTASCVNPSTACVDMGTLLFKEDYGGNNKTDGVYAKTKPSSLSNVDYTFNGDGEIRSDQYGHYVLRKETKFNNGWHGYNYLGDHTHPANIEQGYLFETDAFEGRDIFYKEELPVVLCTETDMTVSFWIANINRVNSTSTTWPNLTFNINCYENGNNTPIRTFTHETGYVERMRNGVPNDSRDPTDWKLKSFSVKLPQTTTKVDVTIKNNTDTHDGNDFALDDFEIKVCPPPASVSAQSNGANIVTKDFCTSEESEITVIGECPDSNGTYGSDAAGKWQYSKDGGKNWIDIPTNDTIMINDGTIVKGNEATMSYVQATSTWKSELPIEVKTTDNVVTDKNYKFRWIVAASSDNLDKPCCRTTSNSFNLNVKAVPAILKSDV
ncbi:MAG: hypothetical protein HUK15_08630, partial [Bacteroidales bacterium]|nr:hypothetical protein [Bacteroidales bacterium]